MVNFEWYRTFVAVYRMESMSAAAQERFLTQPAVSQQIQALEKEVGTSLFVRTPRKMVPTEAGKELYVSIAEAVDRLERTSTQNNPENGPTLRLGVPHEYFYERCTRALAEVPWRTQVQFGLTNELLAHLRTGELDIVIATQRLSDEGVQYAPLYEEQFVLCLGTNWVVPQVGELNDIQKWLVNLPWIAYGSDLGIIRRYWQVVFGERPDMRPKIIVPDLRSILRLVEEGAGVSVLPTYLYKDAEESRKIRVLQIATQTVHNQLWIVYRRKEMNDDIIKGMVSILQRYTQ